MKSSLAIVSILLVHLSFAQKTVCFFRGERIDSTNVNKIINSLDTLSSGYTLSQSEYTNLLDCLFSMDSLNPKLRFYQAANCLADINDTVYFNHYRFCIDKDFETATCYYNLGAGYVNFVFLKIHNDTSTIHKLTDFEKTKLLNLAERNAWLSYSSGFKQAIFLVGEIQKIKNELFKTPPANIDFVQDTLTIIAIIRDCGEFGGHAETIDIVNTGEAIYAATFHSDSIYCQGEKSRLSDNSRYNGLQATVLKENLNALMNAITTHNDKGVFSNAPFEIAVVKNKDVLFRRINSKWSSYLDFRMKTFRF
jgi:hypothetical protein